MIFYRIIEDYLANEKRDSNAYLFMTEATDNINANNDTVTTKGMKI